MKFGKRLYGTNERVRTAIGSMVNGTVGGFSKRGMPIHEQVRTPLIATPLRIELFTSTDDMFSDSFRLAHVYETGLVNTYRNGVGGDSGAKPMDSAPFTQFTLAGSASPDQFYGHHFALDWPYIYARRNSDITKVNLSTGAAATAVETTSFGGTGIDDVAVTPDCPYGFYTVAASSTDVYRWNRGSEPSAAPSTVATTFSGSLDQVVIDADNEHIWIAGDDGIIEKYDFDGLFILDLVIPGAAYVGGVCAAPSGGLIVVTEDVPAGSFTLWYHVSPAGVVTDITAYVTVDGVAWTDIADLYAVTWGSPYIHLTSYGTRIGWGGNYPYGAPLSSLKAYHGTIYGG